MNLGNGNTLHTRKKMSSVRGLRIPESKDFNSDFKGGYNQCFQDQPSESTYFVEK